MKQIFIDLKYEITNENTWRDTFPYINDYLITQLNKQFEQNDVKSIINKISWEMRKYWIGITLKNSGVASSTVFEEINFQFDY